MIDACPGWRVSPSRTPPSTVSIESLWETAFSLKRVVADPEALREAAERDGFSLLPIEARRCSAAQ